MTMFNKTDLATDVASALGIQKRAAAQVIDATLHMILGAAAAGDGYRLAGFGTFAPKTKAARVGRNPRTGQAVDIPARTSLAFKPAKAGKAVE
jgi:DNA-binding protein HU-beta